MYSRAFSPLPGATGEEREGPRYFSPLDKPIPRILALYQLRLKVLEQPDEIPLHVSKALL